MDKSIILDLVFDGRCYGEKINLWDNKEYCKNNDTFDELCEKLCKDLPEEEKKNVLWDLSLARSGMECASADEHFKEGFKLGLKIGAQNFLD